MLAKNLKPNIVKEKPQATGYKLDATHPWFYHSIDDISTGYTESNRINMMFMIQIPHVVSISSEKSFKQK